MGHQVRGVQSPQHRQPQTIFRVQGSSSCQLLLGPPASCPGLEIPPSLPLQGRSTPITAPCGPHTHSVSLLPRQPREAVKSSVTLRRRGAAQVRCPPLSHHVLSGAGLSPGNRGAREFRLGTREGPKPVTFTPGSPGIPRAPSAPARPWGCRGGVRASRGPALHPRHPVSISHPSHSPFAPPCQEGP